MKAQSRQAKTKARQDAFLAAYILIGSVKGAAEAVPVPRATVMKWSSNNVLGFKERYIEAQEDFRESLQDMAMDRVKNQKPGDNPVLLITMLNAHWPEKYRRTGYLADNSAKEIMGEWKKWAKENKKNSGKEESEDRNNAIEQAERILARKSDPKTDESE